MLYQTELRSLPSSPHTLREPLEIASPDLKIQQFWNRGVQTSSTCWYSGTITSALGFIARKAAPKASA